MEHCKNNDHSIGHVYSFTIINSQSGIYTFYSSPYISVFLKMDKKCLKYLLANPKNIECFLMS